MQINLTINLEPDELAMLIKLLGWGASGAAPSMMRRGPGGAVAAETAPDASRGANIPAPTGTPVLAPVAPATDEAGTPPDPLATLATANGLAPLGESPSSPGILGWTPVAEAAAHPPVTTHRRAGRPSKQPPAKRPALMPGEEEPSAPGRLPFDQFDKLVRSEMKRLSMDGRMPNHRLWNDERNVLLPTMAAVLYRYGVTTLVDLAKRLDMQPPLSALGSNGVKVAAP